MVELTWSKVKEACSKITLEPMVFVTHLALLIPAITNNQLILYKTCMEEKFGLDEEFCADIQEHTNTSVYKEEIEPAVARYNVIRTAVADAMPIFLAFYCGSWSDHFGRKPLIYVTHTAKILGAVFALLNVIFIEWSKEVFILTAILPEAIVGKGHIVVP